MCQGQNPFSLVFHNTPNVCDESLLLSQRAPLVLITETADCYCCTLTAAINRVESNAFKYHDKCST